MDKHIQANRSLSPPGGRSGSGGMLSDSSTITYGRAKVEGVEIFYREAGPRDAPTIVLLHGFPSSSRMYEGLLPLLATAYHVIAPDYPGFGLSEAPRPGEYAYTFDQLARSMNGLLEQLGIARYALYLQDYGGPIGFRMMMAHPGRLDALILQNANSYTEGLGPKWEHIAQYWTDPAARPDVPSTFMSLEAARFRHAGDSPNPERYSPESWLDEYGMLTRPGSREIHEALLYDYRTNVAAYPAWQKWLRDTQPPTLVVWGRYDSSFIAAGAQAYARDLPNAHIHLLDAGHFALDEKLNEIAALMLAFLNGHYQRMFGAD